MTLDAFNRGYFRSDGRHISGNANTLSGALSGYLSTSRYNSFYVFDLSSLAGTVDSPALRLELEQYTSSNSTLTFDLFDVSATAAELDGMYFQPDAAGMAIHNDLGSGSIYATQTVSSASVGSVLTIPLSALAESAIESQLGSVFAVGLSVQGPYSSPDSSIRFGDELTSKTIQLEFNLTPPVIPDDDPPVLPDESNSATPEPSSLLIWASISWVWLRRRKFAFRRQVGR